LLDTTVRSAFSGAAPACLRVVSRTLGAESGPDSQSGLSDRTGIYRSDLVATINELTERGLVVRAPDPADHRRNAITLTDEGRRHLKRLDALLAEAEAEFLAPLLLRTAA
jgi:MarR family transcriptional regulator, lower aerobic nicotinate degradation pathway regulator